MTAGSEPSDRDAGPAPEPDVDVALTFLRHHMPDGPWCLSAIGQRKGAIVTQTFMPGEEPSLRSWLRRNVARANIYFTVNPVKSRMARKPTAADIREVRFLHVDIDPRAGEPLESEQERIRAMVLEQAPRGLPPPTFIIFSGGGYQLLWRLRAPVLLDGPEAIERMTSFNIGVRNVLEGDHCQNIDRVLRLPGTINWPDAKKRKRGQEPTTARLEFAAADVCHDLGAFPRYVQEDHDAHRPQVRSATKVPTKVVASVDDLPPLVSDECRRIILHGADPRNPERFESRSEAVWYVTNQLLRDGVDDATIRGVLLNPDFGISAHVLEQPRSSKYAERQIEKAKEGELVVSFGTPMLSAIAFKTRERPHLLRFRGDWLDYDGACYRLVEDDTIVAEIYSFLARAKVRSGSGLKPCHPNKQSVGSVHHALEAVAHVEGERQEPPCWLGKAGPSPLELIACRNGLLRLPTGELLDPTPEFFTRNAVDIAFDAGAPHPVRWHAFLKSLWPDDAESISTLQEMFGYLLVPDTRQQKMFLIVGPKRCGKGTIARVLGDLVGHRNVCDPSLASLSGEFGLQQFLGKQLAVLSDMRLGPRTDQAAIAENLLRISGEDRVSVNRKYRDHWNGTLSTRLLIISNQLPRFADASGALANRFVPLAMRTSFFGRENPALSDELREELPGILVWAREGWLRLRARGRFVLPSSSADAVQDLVDLAAPVAAFVGECCELEPEARVGKDELFDAYRVWSELRGNQRALAKEVFCQDVLAAFTGVASVRPRRGAERPWMFQGLRLRSGSKERPPF